MDCSEVLEIIDAYALGAVAPEEAAQLEAHVADCLRCWEELVKAQRTAALLALSVPMEEASSQLGDRITAVARREAAGIHSEPRVPLLRRLGFSWGTAAFGFGTASVAALAFAGVLQAQVNDLRDENSDLESQVQAANGDLRAQVGQVSQLVEDQGTILAVAISGTDIEMKGASDAEDMSIKYAWSADQRAGIITCAGMPQPPDGKVYQVWFSANSQRFPVETFTPEDGACLVLVALPESTPTPTGIGISIEDPDAISDGPEDGWAVYAHLPEN
ncbi:MAG: anti-sigma factor [Dehalococcoidia bacterium]